MMELLTLKDDDEIYTTIVKEHLNQRKIILNEDIDDNIIENICLMIMQWNKEDKGLPRIAENQFIFILIQMVEMLFLDHKY